MSKTHPTQMCILGAVIREQGDTGIKGSVANWTFPSVSEGGATSSSSQRSLSVLAQRSGVAAERRSYASLTGTLNRM